MSQHERAFLPSCGILGCLVLALSACGQRTEPAAAPEAPPPAAAASAAPAADCPASGELQYICGPRNAEDIVQLGTSDWLVVSGMSSPATAQGAPPVPGRMYLVSQESGAFEEWFPAAAPVLRHDKETFGACPGPLNTANFSAHGLDLREQSAGRHRLYMTSHGEREAIEIFEIDSSGAKPAIAWIGCVVLPDKTFANSVAILNDGGFVTTKMMDPTVPNPFAGVMGGAITGNVYEWHPGGKVTAVPGTEMSGANGIAVSPDNRWLYVAAIGSREIVRFDREAKPIRKRAVPVEIRPDNLRWADGKLYTTGGNYIPPAQCQTPPCSTGWSVLEIDPESMQVRRIAGMDQTATLQGASTAVPVGNRIWVGTFNGDRIGHLPKPPGS